MDRCTDRLVGAVVLFAGTLHMSDQLRVLQSHTFLDTCPVSGNVQLLLLSYVKVYRRSHVASNDVWFCSIKSPQNKLSDQDSRCRSSRHLEHGRSLDPEYSGVYLDMGQLLMHEGRHSEALDM